MYAISLTKFATGIVTAVSIALKIHPKLIEPILMVTFTNNFSLIIKLLEHIHIFILTLYFIQ